MKVVHLLKDEYRDSFFLMRLSNEVSAWPGVRQAVIVMGTESNRRILSQVGLLVGDAETATSADLVIAAEVDAPLSRGSFLARLDQHLRQMERGARSAASFDQLPEALAERPDAALVAISVPGEHAVGLARQALEQGRHVFCFSHHITVEDEIALKRLALAKGLLMMGPDCGTAILDGVGLGFANQVRAGCIGVVSASGSGLQEVTTLIHRAGGGISQGIGVGGRDMQDPIHGLMAEAAVRLLARVPQTRVIVLLAKKASPEAQRRVLGAARDAGLPVVADFLSMPDGFVGLESGQVVLAETFEGCARQAMLLAGLPWNLPTLVEEPQVWLDLALAELPSGRWAVRGLYTGGSLCAEAADILSAHDIDLRTNLDGPLDSPAGGHALLDLGAEEYTEGRAHPFIDPRLRSLEIEAAFADRSVGILLLDVVLGWGCHADPAGEVAAALRKARHEHGPGPLAIASLCGTPEDPQNLNRQREQLQEAGCFVATSNAAAAYLASEAAARVRREA